MEYDKIKQLMDDMGNSKLTEINIDFPDGTKISMKKEAAKAVVTSVLPEAQVVTEVVNSEAVNSNEETETQENLKFIKSPMVGTFYLKPSPTSEPYVKVGDKLTKGQTVCIIEAMKLMNEIESEFDGEIVQVYVKDGEPVEYGTKLFGIK